MNMRNNQKIDFTNEIEGKILLIAFKPLTLEIIQQRIYDKSNCKCEIVEDIFSNNGRVKKSVCIDGYIYDRLSEIFTEKELKKIAKVRAKCRWRDYDEYYSRKGY